MSEFLASLTTLNKVYFVCALAGGLFFIIRTILLLIGADSDVDTDVDIDVDMDMDFDTDADAGDVGDSDASFRVLTIQGVTVFLMMFGLVGLSFSISLRLPGLLTFPAGVAAGVISVYIIAKLMQSISKLQSSGTLNLRNAIGQEGTVYLTIPAKGTGKIQVIIQGRLKVLDAISHLETKIGTNEKVLVVDVVNETLVVEKK